MSKKKNPDPIPFKNEEQKPCIVCGKTCDIFSIQLGDMFTLTLLRVCNFQCLFDTALEFLYELQEHKTYSDKLWHKQHADDRKLRDEVIQQLTSAFLEDQRKHFEENPKLLSTPIPQGIFDTLKGISKIPISGEGTIRFSRPKLEDRIKWQKNHIESLKEKLKKAETELEAMNHEK
jgi:hypothetical protein